MKAMASFLLPLMLQGTILGVFVLAVQAVLRKRLPPPWNIAMWALVFLKFLIPIRIESVFSAFGLFAGRSGVMPVPFFASTLAPSNAPIPPTMGAILPQPTSAAQGLSDLAAMATPSAASIDWALWLSCAWIVGAVLLTLLYLRQYYVLTIDIYKNRSTFADERIDAIARSCFETAGISPHTEIVFSSHAKSPFVFGLGKALIAIPGHLVEQMSDDDLRAVLLHEATHIRRNHHRLRFALSLIAFAYWWNPLVWLFSKQVNREMEYDCDRQTLSRGEAISRKVYADALVRLAGWQGRDGTLTLSFGESHFKERIVAILENRVFSRTVSIMAIAMLVVTGVAFFTMPKPLADAATQPPSASHIGNEASNPTPIPDTMAPTSTDYASMASDRFYTPIPKSDDGSIFDSFSGLFGGLRDKMDGFTDWIVTNADTHKPGKTLNGGAIKVLESSEWTYERIVEASTKTTTQDIPIQDGDTLRIDTSGVRLCFERYDGDTLRVEFVTPSDAIINAYTFSVASIGTLKTIRAEPKTTPTITNPNVLPSPYTEPKAVRVLIPKRVKSLSVVELNMFAVVSTVEGLQTDSLRVSDDHGRIYLDQNESRELYVMASMDSIDVRHEAADHLGLFSSMSNVTIQMDTALSAALNTNMDNADISFGDVSNFSLNDSMSNINLTLSTVHEDSSIKSSMGSIHLQLPTSMRSPGLTVTTKNEMGSISTPAAWKASKTDGYKVEDDFEKDFEKATYVFGGGSPKLTVETSMGNIDIVE